MNFLIKANNYTASFNNTNDYILTIWAKGNKEIKSTLEGGNSILFQIILIIV